ncbi:sugar phosphate isomerase/epimerase family protein [Microbacterium sp. SSW1-59]|uniref:sugar phosphate isomerase/epimerase family protein n=1 Tax=Microbacterium xanthum TaxID=3079794 RepID=UPI002AD4675E|nr:sugar phosphate isomerase/epimerase family protein [Microbacterium sp. SSW1-59]MDZ8201671.1 sugar phosphate isomerase/epimerase family protein [Microbacterium sp. SSW1-59]
MRRATWTLSGFGDEVDPNPDTQVAVLQALGASHVEVRSAWGVNVVDLDEEQISRLGKLLEDRGMKVSAIASPIGKVASDSSIEDEVARLEKVIGVTHALGAANIRVFSFYPPPGRSPQSVRDDVLSRMHAMARVAEREGVVLVHENEKAIYGDIPDRVLDVVESVGSSALRLAWDNANFVQVGVRPYSDGWALLSPYVDYFQVKDARAQDGAVVPAGTGDGQLRETMIAMRDSGYRGFASLEPHLASAHELGGFSGPVAFGEAARAFRHLADDLEIALS